MRGRGSHEPGYVSMYTGQLGQARAHLEEACATVRPGAPRARTGSELTQVIGVTARAYLAVVLWNLGYAREALQSSEESLALAEQVGGAISRTAAWSMHAGLLMSRGRMREFGEWLQRRRIHADRAQRRLLVDRLLAVGAWTSEGRPPEPGNARLRERIDEYYGTGGRLGLPHFHTLMADVRIAAGDGDAALEALEPGHGSGG